LTKVNPFVEFSNGLALTFGIFTHTASEGVQYVILPSTYSTTYSILTTCNYDSNNDVVRTAAATKRDNSSFGIKAVYVRGAISQEYAGTFYYMTIGY